MAKVREFQIYEGKSITGMVTENHIANIFAKDPYYASDMIERLYSVNWQDDFVSMVNKYPRHVVKEKEYRWRMQGMTDKNKVLLGAWVDKAGTIAISDVVNNPNQRVGIGGTKFYMDFDEMWFGKSEIIVGNKPDMYRLWITEVIQINASLYRYEVQLIGDETRFIPASELEPIKTKWSKDGGLVSDTLSKEGFGIQMTSPFEFKNRMTQFRMQQMIPGNMFDKGKVYKFKFLADDGTQHTVWFDYFTHEFLRQTRIARAKTFYFSKSNLMTNGDTLNKEASGYAAEAGAGVEELMMASNRHFFNPNSMTIDWLVQTILDASVGKVSQADRDITIGAGEYGLVKLHKMIQKELGSSAYHLYMGDTTGRAYSWDKGNNGVSVNFGQVTGFAHVNGIKVKFMHMPHKDDPIRNKLMSPDGGRASSYEFDVFDFGTSNGKPNIQRVELEGHSDIFAVKSGMRNGFNTATGSIGSPKEIASSTDGSELHYMSWIGAIIWNPSKIIQFKPSILY